MNNPMTRAASFYEQLSKSQQVDVRRGRLGSSGLWQMLIHIEKDRASDATLSMWVDLLIAMSGSAGHDGTPFGKALALTGWSEGRLNQLLSADKDTILVEMRRIGAYLKSYGQKADWDQAANLASALHYGDDESIKRARLRIAGAYYRQADK